MQNFEDYKHERIFQFFGHEIQVVPAGVGENSVIKGSGDFSGNVRGSLEGIIEVLRVSCKGLKSQQNEKSFLHF